MKLCNCKKFPLNLNNHLYEAINEEGRNKNFSLAGKMVNLWRPERNLKVSFKLFSTNPKLVEEILFVANEWSHHCSISFVYEKQPELADIFVSTKNNLGFYSAIGLQSKVLISKNKTSMNLDPTWGLEEGFSNSQKFKHKYCKSLVLHEFGHALGLVHEHQREDRPFNLNINYIRKNFKKMGMPTFEIAKENIINTYDPKSILKSRFDYKSIMIYPFNKETITENFQIKIPWELSKIDKRKISKIYP